MKKAMVLAALVFFAVSAWAENKFLGTWEVQNKLLPSKTVTFSPNLFCTFVMKDGTRSVYPYEVNEKYIVIGSLGYWYQFTMNRLALTPAFESDAAVINLRKQN